MGSSSTEYIACVLFSCTELSCYFPRDGTASITYCYKDPVSNNNSAAEKDRDQHPSDTDSTSESAPNSQQPSTQYSDSAVDGSNLDGTNKTLDSRCNNDLHLPSSDSGNSLNVDTSPSDRVNWQVEEIVGDKGAKPHWLWYERPENEEDFEVRNKQVILYINNMYFYHYFITRNCVSSRGGQIIVALPTLLAPELLLVL